MLESTLSAVLYVSTIIQSQFDLRNLKNATNFLGNSQQFSKMMNIFVCDFHFILHSGEIP